MSKRKRGDSFDDALHHIDDQAIRVKASRLKAKVHQGTKTLIPALKLARGFERQKLGRRQKTASHEPHTLLRLREEVIVLKQLDMEPTAKTYLLKQLVKTKRIRENPVFIAAYGSEPELETTKPGAESNVLGRLFNATPVKQVMPDIMKGIFDMLGIPQNPIGDANGLSKGVSTSAKGRMRQSEDDEFNGFSSDDNNNDSGLQYQQADDSDNETLKSQTDRLAFSDDDSGSEASLLQPSQHGIHNGHLDEDISDSSDTGGALGAGQSTRSRTAASINSDKSVSKTSFLPSLSMAGYYSGSETEDFDSNEDENHAAPQIRKNRRGQRARQQIAEWKHGKNAKHLQKQPAENVRSTGWDATRGAVDSSGAGARRFGKPNAHSQTGGNSIALGNRYMKPKDKPRDDQGPIHPSWEAAKKRKLQTIAQPTFAGKKITFD